MALTLAWLGRKGNKKKGIWRSDSDDPSTGANSNSGHSRASLEVSQCLLRLHTRLRER